MYTLRLLGTASIEGSDGPRTGRATQGRRLALLAMLAAARGRALSRDKLVAVLWPEATPERARPQLSDALYILRGALGEDVIRATGDDLSLNPAVLTIDVVRFEDAVVAGRLEEAVELYGGPFLDGFHVPDSAEFEEWLDAERSRLGRQYARALEALADAAGDHAASVSWWRRRAALDPLDGAVALRLMQSLGASGDRAGALRHATIHATLLREELDAEPDGAITALAEKLRREPPAAPTPTHAPLAPAQAPAAAVAPKEVAPVPAPPLAGAEERPRKPRRLRALVVPVMVVALALTAIYGASRGGRTASARSVGVLPFVNMSPDPTNTYFSDGLSEQIILALSRVDGLRVAARTSSFALRNRELSVRAIGDTLDVQAVLEGSVLVDGNRLRVIAQLIDARTGFHLWSAQYDGDRRDALALQDSVAYAIAGALHLQLAGNDAKAARPAISPEAYDLYLRGLYLRNSLQADQLRQASAFFDRAIALEPRFAGAWAAKASVVAPMAYFRYANRDSIVAQLRTLTSRALELDPRSSEAYAALGVLKLFFDWDWAGAEAALQRAVALNPNDAHAWHHLANYYAAMSRSREAAAARSRALQLDPLNARTLLVGATDLLLTGDTAVALDRARRGARLDPAHPLLLGVGPSQPAGVPFILMSQGRHDEAVEEYLRVAALRGATRQDVESIRSAYTSSGVAGFWRAWLAMDQRQSPSPDPMRMASLHALSGDTAAALGWLERAYAERNPGLIYLLHDSSFEPLRAQPRFVRIARAMKLPR
ncbi:MAG TPA: tetratricopeptide repeat protein [Gemmatimonadaceae bacterium]